LRALAKTRCRNEPGERQMAPIDPVRRLPEKATRAEAIGCWAYVSTWPRFGKGQRPVFEVFVTPKRRPLHPKSADGTALARNPAKAQLCKLKRSELKRSAGNAIDRSMKNPGQRPLEDARWRPEKADELNRHCEERQRRSNPFCIKTVIASSVPALGRP